MLCKQIIEDKTRFSSETRVTARYQRYMQTKDLDLLRRNAMLQTVTLMWKLKKILKFVVG